ncbi:MAG: histidine kinase dimerization/phospho-acceptor domain-containing protein, partial [Bacillota bacterium]|nr:histidine kinase dimerization/phospho-acceptor domain-containing protein [Bacillota bacterium]
MKRAVSARIILVSLTALLLSSLIFGLILQKDYENSLQDETFRMLEAADISVQSFGDMDAFAKKLSELYNGYRITVLKKDGTVLGDSHADAATLENHSGRAEIKDAIKFGKGVSVRRSETLNIKMMYIAYLSPSGLLLRAAIPLGYVRESFIKLIPAMAAGIIIAVIAALVLAGRLSESAVRPIKRLTEAVRRVGGGDYSARLKSADYSELSELAGSVNQMTESIEQNVKNLGDERQKLRFLLDSIRQGLIVVDDRQDIVEINKTAQMLFDSGQELAGKPFLYLTRDMQILNALDNCLKTRGSSIFEVNNEALGRVYSVAVNPLSADWIKNGAIIILTDVTQLAQTEQIRREFITNASHELKTPITAIRGFAELLSEGLVKEPDVINGYLKRIVKESDRMALLIDDIIKLSQLEEDREYRQAEDVELLKLAAEAVSEYTPQAQKNNVKLSVSGTGFTVKAVRDDMRRLLGNLIHNAIKYNVSGGSVEVITEKTKHGGVLRVKDTGIGIPERDVPRVFERFYRVDKG